MKVSELKIGMLIECANPEDRFIITSWENNPWLRVVNRSFRLHRSLHKEVPRFGMYVGTKKDIGIRAAWSDKFLLVGKEIVAVDPSSWRVLRPVNGEKVESRKHRKK